MWHWHDFFKRRWKESPCLWGGERKGGWKKFSMCKFHLTFDLATFSSLPANHLAMCASAQCESSRLNPGCKVGPWLRVTFPGHTLRLSDSSSWFDLSALSRSSSRSFSLHLKTDQVRKVGQPTLFAVRSGHWPYANIYGNLCKSKLTLLRASVLINFFEHSKMSSFASQKNFFNCHFHSSGFPQKPQNESRSQMTAADENGF